MPVTDEIASVRSGSAGALTASRNQHGPYNRRRVTPANPSTAAQQAVRASLQWASVRWNNFLIAPHRPGWNVYASSQLLRDRFGDPRHRTGREHYIRSNAPRNYYGLSPVDTAPTDFYLPAFGLPTIIGRVFTQTIQITFDTTYPWCAEAGAALLVASSPSKSLTINFYKGPYRKSGRIDGNPTSPPVGPYTLPSPFPLVVQNKVFAFVRVTMADGRLSTPRRISGITSP